MNYSVATDYNNLNIGKGFKKGSTTVNVDGSPDTSLNLLWTTNLESGDDYILATDSFTANHTANTSSAIPVFYTMPRSIDGIISASNGLPSSPRNFTTSGSGLNFIASNNYFILDPNNPLPNIVTTGSVLILDASQISSYPQTGSNVYDLSGNNNTFQLTNGAVWLSGARSFDLDGIDDYIRLSSPKQLTGQIGFTCLFNLENSSDFRSLLGNLTSPNPGNDEKLGFLGGSPNNIFFRASDNGSAFNWDIGYTSANNNKWNFVAFSRTNTNTLQASLNGGTWVDGGVLAGTFNYDTIGANGDGQFFIGKIRDVKLYDKSLSQAEILQNYYQAPIVTDGLVFAVDPSNLVSYESGSTTTYSLTGSLTGSLVNGVGYSPINQGTFDFDGVDDQVHLLEISQSTAEGWTSSTWVYFDDNASTLRNTVLGTTVTARPGWVRLYNDVSGTNWRTRIILRYTNSSGTSTNLSLYVSPYGSSYVDRTLQREFWQNKWWNFTFTASSLNRVKLYLNGNLVSNSNLAGAQDTGLVINRLGVYDTNSFPLDGKIANCLVYNRELTEEEVSQNFQAQRSRFGI
jgi:hypothetical protein